jgi:SAM-dependent methyltransferase
MAEPQDDIWGLRADDWSELQEPQVRPLYLSALDTSGVGVGTKLLDAACGSGLALALADELDAEVHGFDSSPGLLAIARERVRGAELRVADMEDIPFEDDTFDVVTCFNGLQFADNPGFAVTEMRRVTHPDGHVCVAVWGDYENSDFRYIVELLDALLPDPDADTEDLPGPFRLSGEGQLERVMDGAGLRIELGPHVACPFRYRDLDTALRGLMSSGRMASTARTLGEEALRDALIPELQRFARDDGTYRLNNEFRYVLGHLS